MFTESRELQEMKANS